MKDHSKIEASEAAFAASHRASVPPFLHDDFVCSQNTSTFRETTKATRRQPLHATDESLEDLLERARRRLVTYQEFVKRSNLNDGGDVPPHTGILESVPARELGSAFRLPEVTFCKAS
jgi:hypothetical protein